MEPSEDLLKAVAVTCELTGTTLSPAAARVLATDLSAYPEAMVLGSLVRCRKELRGRLTVADVVARLDDGRPGPEEAWAMIRGALEDDRVTVVWTTEMAIASAEARKIIDDPISARMAFIERYRTMVQVARDDGDPPEWVPSLGGDASGREGPLLEAARLGRLTEAHVAGLLPHREPVPAALVDASKALKRIERPKP